MKVQINSIDYSETPIREWGSPDPVAIVQIGNAYANCTIHLENGDMLEYRICINSIRELDTLISVIKDKTTKRLGQLNATTR